jgi:hypothetical protein
MSKKENLSVWITGLVERFPAESPSVAKLKI